MIEEEDERLYNRLKRCPVCGNKFLIPELAVWAYKANSKYYCSWTCYRAEKKYRVPGTRNWVAGKSQKLY